MAMAPAATAIVRKVSTTSYNEIQGAYHQRQVQIRLGLEEIQGPNSRQVVKGIW